MLHLLFGFVLFSVVLAIVAALSVAFFVRRSIRRVRRAASSFARGGGDGGRTGGGRSRSGGSGASRGGETVTDLRPRDVASRRIFADDEGEYVSYKEVD